MFRLTVVLVGFVIVNNGFRVQAVGNTGRPFFGVATRFIIGEVWTFQVLTGIALIILIGVDGVLGVSDAVPVEPTNVSNHQK